MSPQFADAASVFSDGFESGDFSSWSQVQTAIDGKAAIQSTFKSTGSVAAQFSSAATSGSKAYARKTLSAPQKDLTVSGDFQVREMGATGNVPFFRLLDPSSPTPGRVITIYRQNTATGPIYVNYGGLAYKTTGNLPLSTWANVSVHVVTAGAASTVEARMNGAVIYSATNANLGTAGVATVQIGNDTGGQAFNLVADTINVDSVDSGGSPGPSGPVNAAPPTISGLAQSGQTLTASPGDWTGTQPISYAYQWQRCSSSSACAAIAGATAQTYIATGTDMGSTLKVVVTATNPAGSGAATSNPSPVVQGTSSPPTNSSPPTIPGTPQVGWSQTVNPGTWNGTQPISFTYVWQRCDKNGNGCKAIKGATAATYAAVKEDADHTLKVVVTAKNSFGSKTATSNLTPKVRKASSTPPPGGTPPPDGTPPPTGAPGLVALWHMDETSGTVMRDSARTHTGTLNSVTLNQPGSLGRAFGFNGTTSYVSVPPATDLSPGSANINITIRLKATAAPAKPDWDLIRRGYYTSNGGEYKVEYMPGGYALCGFKGSAGYAELTAGPPLNDGQWHTISCVKTQNAVQLIVDGQTFSRTVTIGSITPSEAVPIGARPNSEFFLGSLDEASIQVG